MSKKSTTDDKRTAVPEKKPSGEIRPAGTVTTPQGHTVRMHMHTGSIGDCIKQILGNGGDLGN